VSAAGEYYGKAGKLPVSDAIGGGAPASARLGVRSPSRYGNICLWRANIAGAARMMILDALRYGRG
jgi:hypothetical protein